ncbi:hypothetical protein F4604DRAFT_1686192 [Suillus subluteus]|nr:hypothetical protein F4604DRAFT_1686192 [Suillus subluteus]
MSDVVPSMFPIKPEWSTICSTYYQPVEWSMVKANLKGLTKDVTYTVATDFTSSIAQCQDKSGQIGIGKDRPGKHQDKSGQVRTGKDNSRTDQENIRTSQDRSGQHQDRPRQVRTGQDRSGQVRTTAGQARKTSGQVRTGQDNSRTGQENIRTGQERSGQQQDGPAKHQDKLGQVRTTGGRLGSRHLIFRAWKASILYRNHGGICWMCHVPTCRDELHAPLEKGKTMHIREAAQKYFGVVWLKVDEFNNWLMKAPGAGHYSKGMDLMLWSNCPPEWKVIK